MKNQKFLLQQNPIATIMNDSQVLLTDMKECKWDRY